MGAETKIEWCDHSWSPWVGCTKVSPGCDHCYADGWAKRSGQAVWGHGAPRRRTSAEYWKQPIRWNADAERSGRPQTVFPSLCDPGDTEAPDVWRDYRDLIDATPWLIWLLLTKRPKVLRARLDGFARPNLWAGVSVEGPDFLWRLDELRKIPASGRFVSFEPLIKPMGEIDLTGINWAITGGESGHHARRYDFWWGVDIECKCADFGTASFHKQGGANAHWRGQPWPMKDRKGGDPNEWPTTLKRERPSWSLNRTNVNTETEGDF